MVQLQYISSFEVHRCVVLLCCHWYNLFSRIAKPRADDYFKSINVKAVYQTNEPFIWQIKQHRYFSWKTHLHVAMTGEYCNGLSRGIRLMKLHNKTMLTLLLMYKIPQMFLISLRTITSMTPSKRLPVVLWTYKS